MIIDNEIKHLKHLTKLLSSSPFVKINEELQQKLSMLLNPPGDIEGLRLVDIIDLSLLQLLQDKFSDAYSVSSVICDQEGVPITKSSNFSKFCELARASPDGLRLCRESRKQFLKATLCDSLATLAGCKNFPRLLGTCVPFNVDGYCPGIWCVGQMVVEPFDEKVIRGYAKKLSVNADMLFEYSKELRVETVEDYKKLIVFLDSMCKILSIFGLQNIKQAQEINKRIKVEKKLTDTCYMVRGMCDNLPEMIWCKDLNEKYMFANKAVCENLLFTTTEGVVGKDDTFFALREQALDPGNDKFHTFGVMCHESDQKVLISGKATHLDEEGYLKGKKVILEITKAPFLDENGKMVGVVGSGKFVTELRAEQKKIKESRLKYQTLFNFSQDAVFLIRDDTYVTCNNEAFKMFACTREDLIGVKPTDLSPEFQPDGKNSEDEVQSRISTVIKGIPQKFYWRHIRCDGTLLDVEVRLSKVEIEGDNYHIAVLKEVSDVFNQ